MRLILDLMICQKWKKINDVTKRSKGEITKTFLDDFLIFFLNFRCYLHYSYEILSQQDFPSTFTENNESIKETIYSSFLKGNFDFNIQGKTRIYTSGCGNITLLTFLPTREKISILPGFYQISMFYWINRKKKNC